MHRLFQQKNLNCINQQANDGDTALHSASYSGHTEIVKILLKQTDIQLNIKTNGETPLDYAKGHTEIVKLLKEKERFLKAIVKKISEVKEKYKRSNLPSTLPSFIQAASDGKVKDVRVLLLEKGMDVNQHNEFGMTALMLASFFGHTDAVKSILKHKNLNLNQQTVYGRTALHFASMKGHTGVANLILEAKGVQLDIQDEYEQTADDIMQFKKGIPKS